MVLTNTPEFRRVVRQFGWQVVLFIIWDLLIVVGYKKLSWEWLASDNVPLAIYGSAIGIVAAFRNNVAYSRWWEARTLWGQIVNNSRSLARQVCGSFRGSRAVAAAREIIYLQIAYVHALRQQLRGLDPIGEMRNFVDPELLAGFRSENNVPFALQKRIGVLLRCARERDWIDGWEWSAMDRTLSDLMSSQGGVERIRNTPLPKQYDLFVIMFVHAFCLLLPVGMVSRLGWYTPLGSTVVGVMFLALDRIGRSLEAPFTNGVYDVPLTAIATTIEINLRQTLEDTGIPATPAPVSGVLW